MEQIYGEVSESFWDQHRWLINVLKTQINILSSSVGLFDPVMIFVNHMAQTPVFFLKQIVGPLPGDEEKYITIKTETEQLSMVAVKNISHLTGEFLQLNNFQVSY
jgi:hypothetical protein